MELRIMSPKFVQALRRASLSIVWGSERKLFVVGPLNTYLAADGEPPFWEGGGGGRVASLTAFTCGKIR